MVNGAADALPATVSLSENQRVSKVFYFTYRHPNIFTHSHTQGRSTHELTHMHVAHRSVITVKSAEGVCKQILDVARRFILSILIIITAHQGRMSSSASMAES